MRIVCLVCRTVLEPGIGAGHAHEAACIGERESDRHLPGRDQGSTAVPHGDMGPGHPRQIADPVA